MVVCAYDQHRQRPDRSDIGGCRGSDRYRPCWIHHREDRSTSHDRAAIVVDHIDDARSSPAHRWGDFPAIISPSETFKIPFPLAFNGVIIIQKLLIVVFGLAVFFSIAFALFFKFTRNGLSMRATSEDHELARSVGINVPRVFGLSWAVAGVVATGGGVLLSMLKGASLSLADVVLVAFPAILLGGLESLPGAMVGGIVVGLTRELVATSKLIEIRNSKDIAPYVLLLIVLLIRPEGLFGQKRIERI
jgi:branched-chain amino acid transport system permease protein